MTEIKLPSRSAKRTHRSAEYGARLPVGRRGRLTRKPFQSVLENAGQRKIIFRHREDQRVRGRDLCPESFYMVRQAMLLDVGIVERQIGQIRHFEDHPL